MLYKLACLKDAVVQSRFSSVLKHGMQVYQRQYHCTVYDTTTSGCKHRFTSWSVFVEVPDIHSYIQTYIGRRTTPCCYSVPLCRVSSVWYILGYSSISVYDGAPPPKSHRAFSETLTGRRSGLATKRRFQQTTFFFVPVPVGGMLNTNIIVASNIVPIQSMVRI